MDIEIIRIKQYQDKIRDYHLIVDGKKITKIKPNSTRVISIPDDAGYIQAKIDWCSSPKLYIKDLKTNTILIKNTFGGNIFAVLFLSFFYITIWKGKYLTIENKI